MELNGTDTLYKTGSKLGVTLSHLTAAVGTQNWSKTAPFPECWPCEDGDASAVVQNSSK